LRRYFEEALRIHVKWMPTDLVQQGTVAK